jgi:hypothetical protein
MNVYAGLAELETEKLVVALPELLMSAFHGQIGDTAHVFICSAGLCAGHYCVVRRCMWKERCVETHCKLSPACCCTRSRSDTVHDFLPYVHAG